MQILARRRTRYEKEKAKRQALRRSALQMQLARRKRLHHKGGEVVEHYQRGVRIVAKQSRPHKLITCARCRREGVQHASRGLCQRCQQQDWRKAQREAALALSITPYYWFDPGEYTSYHDVAGQLFREREAGQRMTSPGRRTILGKRHELKCKAYQEYLKNLVESGCRIPNHEAYTCLGGKYRNVAKIPQPWCPTVKGMLRIGRKQEREEQKRTDARMAEELPAWRPERLEEFHQRAAQWEFSHDTSEAEARRYTFGQMLQEHGNYPPETMGRSLLGCRWPRR